MTFYQFLISKGLALKTIQRLVAWQLSFEGWLSDFNKPAKALIERDLLYYLQSEKRNLSRRSLQLELKRIDYYFAWQKLANPLQDFELGGQAAPIKRSYLKGSELRQIYLSYIQNSRLSLESKIMVGFLALQGLTSKELPIIQASQILLKQAVLDLPERHLQARTIPLQAVQMPLTMELLAQKEAHQLLFTYKNDRHLQNKHTHLVHQINKELAKQNTGLQINNLAQIRASCIAHWINTQGILTAQYLTGHKHLTATQSYQAQEVETLREAFKRKHPMF